MKSYEKEIQYERLLGLLFVVFFFLFFFWGGGFQCVFLVSQRDGEKNAKPKLAGMALNDLQRA